MAVEVVPFDPAASPGSKFPAPVIAEITEVAPSTVDPGSITTTKLAAGAVTTPKLAAGAVTSDKIGAGEVKTANIDDLQVTTTKLAGGAVTPAKAGTGIVTAYDGSGNARTLKAVTMTVGAFAGIVSPDPNTLYVLT